MMRDNEYDFLKNLNDAQKKACLEEKNVLLRACPGSGKTRTLTQKLAYLTIKNLKSYKKNIAITYTNRAAEEIKSRVSQLNIDTDKIWTGTIHQFCLEYIIRPYSMYSNLTKKGYDIIDEYTQKKYIKETCEKLQIPFNNNENMLENGKVYCEYKKLLKDRKQIDFIMILEISYNILKEKDFVAKNIANIIGSILVDEYQDTNLLQYQILERIYSKNKKINLFFVGDINQAIYGELGGIAKSKIELEKMYNTKFIELELSGCYRSTQDIINYYKKFQIEETDIESCCNLKNEDSVLYYNKNINKIDLANVISNIIRNEINSGINEEDICVIAPQWWQLFDIGNKLKILLPDIKFDSPEISPIKYDPLNIYYLIARLLFTEKGKSTVIRKSNAKEIVNILKSEYKIELPKFVDIYFILKVINSSKKYNEDGILTLQECIKNLFEKCHINLKQEEKLEQKLSKFLENTNDRISRYKLSITLESIEKSFKIKRGVVINTFHGVKGEEYKVVIAAGLLNGYIPNWHIIINKPLVRNIETKKLLYVICSRAKQKLYLFSEQGRTTQKGIELTPTNELNI